MAPAPETIAGRYELQNVLGRGGMGVVYRGHDRLLDRVVAVKLLPAEFASDPILVQRFEREARAVARLNHPNIVSIFDTGHDGTVHYIVMECVSGESLAQRLSERGALPVSEAVAIAAQIADALAAAHAAGIVHRDIKPGNVMVQPDGECKVLDFGIARAAAEAAMTKSASMLGSVLYMAPEIALGQTADARSDIYSLGCVLYEMLTGELPFRGEVPAAVINQHVSAVPRPPRELTPAIPARLDALVVRMLAKDPAERPQDAASAAAALRDSLRTPSPVDEVALAPTMVAPPAEAPTRFLPPPPQADEPPPPQRSRFPVGLVAAAVLVALLVGIGIALAASSGSDHGGVSSTSTSDTARTSTSSQHSSARTTTTTTATRTSTRSSSRITPSTSTRTVTSTPTTTRTASSTSASSSSAPSASSSTSTTGP